MTMHYMTTTLLFILDVVAGQVMDYKQCCYYCPKDLESRILVQPAWQLTSMEQVITNFTSPLSVFPQNEVSVWTKWMEKEYLIHYGGVPISITPIRYTDPAANHQYIEIHMDQLRDISGVILQSGFYREESNTLVLPSVTWLMDFVISYYSLHNSDFVYVEEKPGELMVFEGTDGPGKRRFYSLPVMVRTHTVRLHPLRAVDALGMVTQAMVRVGLIFCTMDACAQVERHCEVEHWGSWGKCTCRSLEKWGCIQHRTRDVIRYNSCGGDTCPHLVETQTCTLPEAAWVTALKWMPLGIVLLVALIIILVYCLRKLYMKKKRQAFKKTREARERAKEQKEKEKEKVDAKFFAGPEVNGQHRDIGDEFEERDIAPLTKTGTMLDFTSSHHQGNLHKQIGKSREKEDEADIVETELSKMTTFPSKRQTHGLGTMISAEDSFVMDPF